MQFGALLAMIGTGLIIPERISLNYEHLNIKLME